MCVAIQVKHQCCTCRITCSVHVHAEYMCVTGVEKVVGHYVMLCVMVHVCDVTVVITIETTRASRCPGLATRVS